MKEREATSDEGLDKGAMFFLAILFLVCVHAGFGVVPIPWERETGALWIARLLTIVLAIGIVTDVLFRKPGYIGGAFSFRIEGQQYSSEPFFKRGEVSVRGTVAIERLSRIGRPAGANDFFRFMEAGEAHMLSEDLMTVVHVFPNYHSQSTPAHVVGASWNPRTEQWEKREVPLNGPWEFTYRIVYLK